MFGAKLIKKYRARGYFLKSGIFLLENLYKPKTTKINTNIKRYVPRKIIIELEIIIYYSKNNSPAISKIPIIIPKS